MPSFNKPRWEKYAQLPEWEILEATALSLDMEPVEVRRWLTDGTVKRSPHDVSVEFGDRFEILLRNATAGKGFGQPMHYPLTKDTLVSSALVSRWLATRGLIPATHKMREIARERDLPPEK